MAKCRRGTTSRLDILCPGVAAGALRIARAAFEFALEYVVRGHRPDLADSELVRELADGLLFGRQGEIERHAATKGTRLRLSSGPARRAG